MEETKDEEYDSMSIDMRSQRSVITNDIGSKRSANTNRGNNLSGFKASDSSSKKNSSIENQYSRSPKIPVH